MWMTRKRSHELIYSLTSFINNADDNKNIEYLFILDPDDEETVDALKKVIFMCDAQDAGLKYFVMDKRYGYTELEQYQNKAGELFTGECLIILNDDLICVEQGWDTKLRKLLDPLQNVPAWIGIVPINEWWKGSLTFVGINRTWYDVVGRVSGTRATDGYLMLMGQLTNIPPIRPDVKFLHLQRGKSKMDYDSTKKKIIHGLPDDGAGGYTTKKKVDAKYVWDHGEGKQRLNTDVNKLIKWLNENLGE